MGSDLILTGWQCDFLSLFFLFRYLNAIQTMCPHILRYLTTAVITNKDVRKRRQVLKDLVKVIQQVKTEEFVCDDISLWIVTFVLFFSSCRSRTRTKTRSQNLWSVSTWTLTLTAHNGSWGSVSRWGERFLHLLWKKDVKQQCENGFRKPRKFWTNHLHRHRQWKLFIMWGFSTVSPLSPCSFWACVSWPLWLK